MDCDAFFCRIAPLPQVSLTRDEIFLIAKKISNKSKKSDIFNTLLCGIRMSLSIVIYKSVISVTLSAHWFRCSSAVMSCSSVYARRISLVLHISFYLWYVLFLAWFCLSTKTLRTGFTQSQHPLTQFILPKDWFLSFQLDFWRNQSENIAKNRQRGLGEGGDGKTFKNYSILMQLIF